MISSFQLRFDLSIKIVTRKLNLFSINITKWVIILIWINFYLVRIWQYIIWHLLLLLLTCWFGVKYFQW